MSDEYDSGAFAIFVIALLSIYICVAGIFIVKRIRRVVKKEPFKKTKKAQLVEVEEEVVENPLTIAFWINVILVMLATIVVIRLVQMSSTEEAEVFDPYMALEISIGSSDKVVKAAYRKMAKIYHPDKPTGSVDKFRDIEKAYRILTDEIAKVNYERYGNPDGPTVVKVGVALPEWMSQKSGSKLVVISYLLLMILGIPALVYCLKSRSGKQEKPKIKEETISSYYHAMNESSPLQSVPEIFSVAEELLEVMKPQPYDDDLLIYLNTMCPKNSFSSSKMRKPRAPLEKAKEDVKIASWLKTNILVHAYLNNLEVTPSHQRDQQIILKKAPELLREMFGLSMYPRIRGKPASLALALTVMHFQQYMYQGLWLDDSALKQLPHMSDREANANRSRNRDNDLKDFITAPVNKWKGMKHLLAEQMEEVEAAVKHLPQLEVEARLEVEDEEDIFVGDMVTCVLKIVQKNLLPVGMTVAQAMKGEMPEEVEEEEEEEEEEEKEKEKEKVAMSAEDLSKLSAKAPIRLEQGIVLSKRFPYRIHEHWVVVLSDREDKSALDAVVVTTNELFVETRAFPIRPMKDGVNTYHLHFLCPVYVGLDFVVPVSMRVKPESQKPKIEVNQKDLELDKKKGLMDMLNMEEDDGWESSDDEDREEKREKREKREKEGEEGEEEEEEEEEEEKEEEKDLTKKERKRLYHQKKQAVARKAKKEAAKREAEEKEVEETEVEETDENKVAKE